MSNQDFWGYESVAFLMNSDSLVLESAPRSRAFLLYKEGTGTAVVYCLFLHSLVFIFFNPR